MNNNLQIDKVREHIGEKNNARNSNDSNLYKNFYNTYKNKSVLEIGCYDSPLASKEFKKYIGIDRNLPTEHNPNLLEGKFEELNIEGTFDVCICKDTSRYFSSPHEAIELMFLYSHEVIISSVEPYFDVTLYNKFKTIIKKIAFGARDWDIDYQNNYSLLDVAIHFSNTCKVKNHYDGYRRTIHIKNR